mmetsp:Transcript_70350/g.153280  ORF Transcript_70350/g.153280 Transcript_70350/m.153280 type:complete len:407 (-) Transcript_70350:97-1317(-)
MGHLSQPGQVFPVPGGIREVAESADDTSGSGSLSPLLLSDCGLVLELVSLVPLSATHDIAVDGDEKSGDTSGQHSLEHGLGPLSVGVDANLVPLGLSRHSLSNDVLEVSSGHVGDALDDAELSRRPGQGALAISVRHAGHSSGGEEKREGGMAAQQAGGGVHVGDVDHDPRPQPHSAEDVAIRALGHFVARRRGIVVVACLGHLFLSGHLKVVDVDDIVKAFELEPLLLFRLLARSRGGTGPRLHKLVEIGLDRGETIDAGRRQHQSERLLDASLRLSLLRGVEVADPAARREPLQHRLGVDGLEGLSAILASKIQNDLFAAWVERNEAAHVIDSAVEGHPAAFLLLMHGQLGRGDLSLASAAHFDDGSRAEVQIKKKGFCSSTARHPRGLSTVGGAVACLFVQLL